VPALEALAAASGIVDLAAVVTQPDRPAGRGLQQRATPVMNAARALGLTAYAPPRLDEQFVGEMRLLGPHLLACASYGKILPSSLLSLEGMHSLNVHPSLLPEYRGASPIQAALRDGRNETGITIFWMTREMDAGDIAVQQRVDIAPDENYGRLHDRLAELGANLLVDAAQLLAEHRLPRIPQDHERATYTRPIQKDELRISADASAGAIINLVRSASPVPAAWMMYRGKRLKVLEARAEPSSAEHSDGEGPLVRAADGLVRLTRVIPEGKREMTGAEFARSLDKNK
jgi:methionyl-tRNA formyltransferase